MGDFQSNLTWNSSDKCFPCIRYLSYCVLTHLTLAKTSYWNVEIQCNCRIGVDMSNKLL